jgi:hypothetical protein
MTISKGDRTRIENSLIVERMGCNFDELALYYDLDGCVEHRNRSTACHPGLMIQMVAGAIGADVP